MTGMKEDRIRESAWRLFRSLRDKRKQMTERAKDRLEGLPQRTKRRIVLGMLAVFAVLALYTFGKAVYDIGRDESRKMEIDHAGQVELSIKPTVSNHSTPYYLYGTDED